MSAIEASDREGPVTAGEENAEFASLKKQVKAAHQARSKWRKEAIKSFDYVAGLQWSEEDQRLLNEQKRPAITFNRTAPIIKAVCGLEVNNRQGIIFLPREMGDIGPNEVLSDAVRWVRDECNAEDEESTAFRDNAICGEGWTETRIEYDEDPQGKIIEERIDPLEMGVNVGSKRANHSDARLIYRVRDIEVEDAKAMFGPDYLPEAMHANWLDDDIIPADGGIGNKKDYPNETRSGLERAGKGLTKCRVIQVQWWQRETVHLVAQDGQQELQTLSPEDFAKFEERAQMISATQPDQAIQYTSTKVPQKVYYEAFLGNGMIGPKKKLEMGMFHFRAMTGEYDRTGKCFYALMRDMFDPQMWANKWLSQTLHIMNSTAKGGIMAETDAFVNQRKAEADWADNTKIVWAKPGAISKAKIKERMPPPMPNALGDLMTFAISSIRDVTGVNLELLGQADREQAASLEMQRRQSAMTILATLFDSLRRYRKGQGRLLLHFIQLLPDGTLVRVLKDGEYRYVPLAKDKMTAKFDVIIDEAPTSPNQKEAVWVFLREFLQTTPLPPEAVVKLLRYSPLPESAVQDVMESLGLGKTDPPEVLQKKLAQAEQALQVMEQQLKEAMETAKTAEDEQHVKMLEIQIDDYRAETERLKVELDAQAKEDANIIAATQREVTANGPQTGGSGSSVQVAGDNGMAELSAKLDQLTSIIMQMAQGGAPAAPQPPEQPQLV